MKGLGQSTASSYIRCGLYMCSRAVCVLLFQIFDKREAELMKRSLPLECTCFKTSIWDETLYKVWGVVGGVSVCRYSSDELE